VIKAALRALARPTLDADTLTNPEKTRQESLRRAYCKIWARPVTYPAGGEPRKTTEKSSRRPAVLARSPFEIANPSSKLGIGKGVAGIVGIVVYGPSSR
jgi:hypothetical protein